MREPGEISYECIECGATHVTDYGEEKTDDDGNLICEDCATPKEWEEQDFPLWIRYKSYDDDYRLELKMSNQIDIPRHQIPDGVYQSGSDFKHTKFNVWFKVHEDLSVEGPYGEKKGEKL